MSKGYWVKGNLYVNSDRKKYIEPPVIHRFDTIEEAWFFKSQIANGEILDWGDGKELKEAHK